MARSLFPSVLLPLAFVCLLWPLQTAAGKPHAVHPKPSPLSVLPPLPSQFNEPYGKQMLYMSYLEAWNCEYCGYNPDFVCDVVLSNTSTGAYGYVAHSAAAKTIVLGFRGSDNLPNDWLDIDPFKVRPYRNVQNATVHAGFMDGYDSLTPQLRPVVIRLISSLPITTIVCTGHSLGAALSGLCGLDMRLLVGDKVPEIAVINMGMPRTGNRAFADYYATQNITTWRCVHYHDIVPHLPFEDVPIEGGYHHVATEIWEYNQTDPMQWKVCDSSGEDPTCADSVPVWEWSPPDHLNYFGVPQDNCGGPQ